DRIVKYVMNQQQHHKKESFREEFIRLLKENGIEFDEKYLLSIYISYNFIGGYEHSTPAELEDRKIGSVSGPPISSGVMNITSLRDLPGSWLYPLTKLNFSAGD
ncbi:MAG: hypothetical protein ACM3RX_01955, partial [Methanococcaceae archaeon]